MSQTAEVKKGRIFTIRIDHGDDLIAELKRIIRENEVKTGIISYLGALKNPILVAGALEPVIPTVTNKLNLKGAWDVVGFGTISSSSDGPFLHLHGSVGKGNESYTGCIRESAEVYLVIEAVITEFTGINSIRRDDPLTGQILPFFLKSEDVER